MQRYATALRSISPAQRRVIVTQLCDLGAGAPPSAVPYLLPMLADEDQAVRDGVATVLVRVGQSSSAGAEVVVRALARMLEDRQMVVRMRAATLAGRIGPNAAPLIPNLLQALRNKHQVFCRLAAEALYQIGPDSRPALEALRNDPDPYIQREARWALNKLQTKTIEFGAADTIIVRPEDIAAEVAKGAGVAADAQHQSTQAVPVIAVVRSEGRENLRHASRRETYYRFLPDDLSNGLWWQAEIQDVSAEGMGLILSRPAARGGRLMIDLTETHKDLTRQALARVVHCHRISGGWFAGCAFLGVLSEEEMHLLRGPSRAR